MKTVISQNGISIRLTDERWQHILFGHPELEMYQQDVLNTITSPEDVLDGKCDELIAVSMVNKEKYLLVIYKENEKDGFIITAYFSDVPY